MEHSSPGGHCSSKRHPSKLFHARQYGGFAGRFALSSPVSSSTGIIRKAPTDTSRVRREKYAPRGRPKRAVLAWAQLGTGRSSPQPEEWDLSPKQGVHTGVSARELGAYAGKPEGLLLCPGRGACLPLSFLDPSDQISSSCHRSLGTQLTPGSRTLICLNPGILGGSTRLSALPAPSVSYLPPLAEEGAAITSHLLLARNDMGIKALLPQTSSRRPWWLHYLPLGKVLGGWFWQQVVKDASQQKCKTST